MASSCSSLPWKAQGRGIPQAIRRQSTTDGVSRTGFSPISGTRVCAPPICLQFPQVPAGRGAHEPLRHAGNAMIHPSCCTSPEDVARCSMFAYGILSGFYHSRQKGILHMEEETTTKEGVAYFVAGGQMRRSPRPACVPRETAVPASGPRPACVPSFGFHLAARVRSASSAVSPRGAARLQIPPFHSASVLAFSRVRALRLRARRVRPRSSSLRAPLTGGCASAPDLFDGAGAPPRIACT
eukprot:gene8336-biopygen3122